MSMESEVKIVFTAKSESEANAVLKRLQDVAVEVAEKANVERLAIIDNLKRQMLEYCKGKNLPEDEAMKKVDNVMANGIMQMYGEPYKAEQTFTELRAEGCCVMLSDKGNRNSSTERVLLDIVLNGNDGDDSLDGVITALSKVLNVKVEYSSNNYEELTKIVADCGRLESKSCKSV